MEVVTKSVSTSNSSGEPTVRSIIASARSIPNSTRARGAWIAAGVSGLLLWASFPPLDWGALGWIALVPLILLVRPETRPRGTWAATLGCGFVSQLMMLQWLRYGDPTMYAALIALACYMALYPLAFVLLSRVAVHRCRVPLVLAVPTIWVGLEFARAHFLTGFAWYFLGHTQYRWIELIQISDLCGAYGVSFVVAASAAALATVVPDKFLVHLGTLRPDSAWSAQAPRRVATPISARPTWAVGVSLALVAATLAYGYVRRAQARFVEGPRIALVQGNFTAQVKHDPGEVSTIFNKHYVLTGEAAKWQPDVIIWPETMLREPLLIKSPNLSDADMLRLAPFIPVTQWRSNHLPELLRDMSRQAGAGMIFGLDAFVAEGDSLKRYNSAVYSDPFRGVVGRYDKIHRVIFGEYIPLKEALPFLKSFVPYGAGFGLDAGSEATAFQVKGWQLAPIICFEDTVPHLVRRTVQSLNAAALRQNGRPVDCLVNLTNDGWFHGSSGLDQHLIGSLFRCVECRKPMVRAVNTGISAVIDGDGVVVEPEVFIDADRGRRSSMRDAKTGRWRRDLNAVLVDSVPLDNRTSVYLRYGDWFAGTCALATLAVLLAGIAPGAGCKACAEPAPVS